MKKKKRMKKNKLKKSKQMSVAIAWYKPDQWTRLREIASDSDKLEETYVEWEIIAENAIKDFAASGFSSIKVEVDVDELLAWCNENNMQVNAEARSQYAAWLVKECEKGNT